MTLFHKPKLRAAVACQAVLLKLTGQPHHAGLENYTAVVEHNVEYVESQQQVNFINAQIIKAGTQQTLSIVNRVRALCFAFEAWWPQTHQATRCRWPSMIYQTKDSAARADGACGWSKAATMTGEPACRRLHASDPAPGGRDCGAASTLRPMPCCRW